MPGTTAVEDPKAFAPFELAKQVAAAERPVLDVNIPLALYNIKQFESFKKQNLHR